MGLGTRQIDRGRSCQLDDGSNALYQAECQRCHSRLPGKGHLYHVHSGGHSASQLQSQHAESAACAAIIEIWSVVGRQKPEASASGSFVAETLITENLGSSIVWNPTRRFELEPLLNRRDVAACLNSQAVLNFTKASCLVCRPSWLFWRCSDCFGNNPDLNRISLK